MGESLRIREVGPGDWPQVRVLRLAMMAESPGLFADVDDAARALDETRWRERRGDSMAWHAVSDAAVVGSVSVTPATRALAELHSLWIAPAWRRCGVATCLLEVAIRCWRERGGNRLMLWVPAANEPAKALYERERFRASAQVRDCGGQSQLQYARRV